jgi:internalin A
LNQLEYLNLSNNKIPYLAPLKELTELKILDISKNRIISIVALSNLEKLQVLNISRNNIQDVNAISKHLNLLHLGLHKTKIKNLDKVCTISNLLSLDIGGNSISSYNLLEKLEKLISLNISFSKIRKYDFLNHIKELRSLNISGNNLIDIGFLNKTNHINNLSLSSNKINDLSPLANLAELNILNLDRNSITDITPLIPLLKKGLSTSINDSVGGIQLRGNPISTPPLEIIEQGRQSILDWFDAIKRELKEIKIILIGDPKAGKTSLLRRLKEDQFVENEMQTDGVNIERLEFGNCQTFEKQTLLHKLTGYFWDFGGQEIMHATHQFFLTKRSVYILILDARKDNGIATQIKQWVMRIKSTGGNSDIIIVANQADLNSGFGFENEYELQKEFPQIKYFIKASCKTAENLDLIKERLEELIPKAELFKTEIDERWMNIKEQLQDETKVDYYLGEDRFKEICLASRLEEKSAQKNAISFLHDLGLVLHFDEVTDHEYFVLDPYWITYGVYQILTSKRAGDQKGIVSILDLDFIINEEEDKNEIYMVSNYKKITYNNHQRRFLLDMLCQFKLCFYLPNRSHFIVPDLLETAEPEEQTEPIRNSEDSIQLVYNYEYLPKSIMPQILVETHFYHCKIWRTGCVLKQKECNALVTSYDNQIRIKVIDGHRLKKDFMAIIRSKIDQINERLTQSPNLLIPLPGTNSFVDYEELIERDKDGEIQYSIYKPEKRVFEISQLLEGISTKDEIKQILYEIKQNQEVQSQEHSIIIAEITEVKNKLDQHYQYLIDQPQNNQLKELIEDVLTICTDKQTKEITDEIVQTISNAFEIHQEDLNEKLEEIFIDFKNTSDLQVKLKLGIPLINLLGVDLAAEFNLKSWASKMYKKYEFQIFKIMGLI